MNLQSSVPDTQLYNPSQKARVLGGLRAPKQSAKFGMGADTSNSMNQAAKAMASQNQAGAGMKMADANLANQLQAQQLRSQDLQGQANLYANQYGNMADRRNKYAALNSQEQANRLDYAGSQVAATADWADSILRGLLR